MKRKLLGTFFGGLWPAHPAERLLSHGAALLVQCLASLGLHRHESGHVCSGVRRFFCWEGRCLTGLFKVLDMTKRRKPKQKVAGFSRFASELLFCCCFWDGHVFFFGGRFSWSTMILNENSQVYWLFATDYLISSTIIFEYPQCQEFNILTQDSIAE